jgi:RNA polymerase sigma-70 factor (ECF subfamily)
LEEDILIERSAGGDSGAFRVLVERYQREIFNYFIRSTGSLDDAEDLTQQCFINLYRSLGRYRKKASLRTFIYRIAANLAISFSRKRKSPLSLDLLVEGGYDMATRYPSDLPEEKLHARELQRAYLRSLENLPAEWRTIIELRVGKELSYKEIADIMDRSVPSVESILFRAREKLSVDMAPFLEDQDDKKNY